MKKLLLLFVLLAIQQFSFANDSLPGKHIFFSTKIKKADGKKVNGYLANINDTAISLTNFPLPFGTSVGKESIAYSDISYLNLHNRAAVGRGILIGALTGITIGAITGLSSGDDPPEQFQIFRFTAAQKAVGLGCVFGLTGAITGAIIGALAKQIFTINKSKENFHKMRTTILDKAYGTSRSQ